MHVQILGGMRGLSEVWTGFGITADVLANAVVWTRRRFIGEYRTAKKETMLFRSYTVRYVRRWRSEYGYFVLYHNIEVERYTTGALSGAVSAVYRVVERLLSAGRIFGGTYA